MEENRNPRLIALMLAGDQEAFGLLITRYQPMAQRLAVQFTRNQDVAHELVQEAIVQAYLSLDQLRDTIRFKSWFYGIVLNVCRSYLRAQKLRMVSLDALIEEMPDADLPDQIELDPQELVVERELHFLMLQAVQLLSAKNKAVILLFYYRQLSLREIASSLDISVVTVKSRLKQARKELRARLLQIYPELQQVSPTRKRRKMQTQRVHFQSGLDIGRARLFSQRFRTYQRLDRSRLLLRPTCSRQLRARWKRYASRR